MSTSFDTLALYEKLKESGVPDRQAAAHSAGLNDALAHVATKSDLREVKMDIENLRVATKSDLREVKMDIENLKISTRADMASMKSDLISWIVGMFLGVVVLMVAMVAAVFGLLPLVLK